MAGGDPTPEEDADNRDNLCSSYQDRSVSEIETSFSEHFVPTLEDEDCDTPRVDVEDEEMSSLETKTSAAAIINDVPYHHKTNLVKTIQNSVDSGAIESSVDEDSTSFKAVNKISFKKSFCPVFLKKSFDSDSLLGLATESGSESLACDSAIENEANKIADNIFQDKIENLERENNETFLVSASSDKVVALHDFAFDKQENYFQLSNQLNIPLNIPSDQSLDIPISTATRSSSSVVVTSKTCEDLSLIEEVTEDLSSMNSDSKMKEESLHCNATAKSSKLKQSLQHKPKILQKTRSLGSPCGISNRRVGDIYNDSKLPSKSNPATPREEDEGIETRKLMYAQHKPRVVSKRFQRSPPREVSPSTGLIPKPIQTKTGLILTQPIRDVKEHVSAQCRVKDVNKDEMSRSASSASLILRKSPGHLNLSHISKSSENVPSLGLHVKSKKYDHVESKVKKHIENMNRNQSSSKKPSKTKSSHSLQMSQLDVSCHQERPRTADSSTLVRAGDQKTMRKTLSKSETNLRMCRPSSAAPSSLSKSTFSIGHIGAIYDSSEEDLTQLTAILNDEEVLNNKAESLLELMSRERKSKQEAKKVINELQTSYDDLLQKYAAAENALDKVRFGIKPSDSGSRQEAFMIADKVAEKIANFQIGESREAFKSVARRSSSAVNSPLPVRDHLINLSNEVRYVDNDKIA